MLAAACGGSSGEGGVDAGAEGIVLAVSPADAELKVVDGVVAEQAYTVTVNHPDGTTEDVTDAAVLVLDRSSLGFFDGSTLKAGGAGAGVGTVTASWEGATAQTDVTVRVQSARVVEGTPGNVGDIFDGDAIDSPGQAPAIVYPSDGTMFPPNLGTFEVHYGDQGGNDVYEIAITSDYLDLRVYAPPGFASFTSQEWQVVGASHRGGSVTVTVRGASSAAPDLVGSSAPITAKVASEELAGGIYYWTTTSQGIFRHDFGKPDQAPEPYYTPAETGGNCVGCHTVSRDGTKMTLSVANVGSLVLDVASRQQMGDTQGWGIATWNPSGDLMVTANGGTLYLRDGLGVTIEQVPTGAYATHPDWSPRGDYIAWVSPTTTLLPHENGADNEFFFSGGSIWVQPFDAQTRTFGTPVQLVPENGQTQYFPSFSPDGEWLLFNRSTGDAIDDPDTQLWTVPVDGSLAPLAVGAANAGGGNLYNSWARFAPFVQTTGNDDAEVVYWFTFSSRRAFGNRLALGAQAQLWMAPFFPGRAAAGMDPTLPAFRLPFQDLATSNHIAQWTEAVIPVD